MAQTTTSTQNNASSQSQVDTDAPTGKNCKNMTQQSIRQSMFCFMSAHSKVIFHLQPHNKTVRRKENNRKTQYLVS